MRTAVARSLVLLSPAMRDMERPVQDIDHLARGLLLIAGSEDSPEWLPVWTMARLILERAEEVERLRSAGA